jgi:hypothetical protein
MRTKGALCKEMRRGKHFKTSENGITEEAMKYKKKTKQDIINQEAIVRNYCFVTNNVRICKS